jgi:hypothetical protein
MCTLIEKTHFNLLKNFIVRLFQQTLTRVLEFDNLIGVTVNPNPFVYELHISLPNTGNFIFDFYDISENLV